MLCGKAVWYPARGVGKTPGAGETRARGIGGLKPLENCLGPGADSPSDDGATRLLRATCAQALVAIKATQKQMGLERCTGGPERSWWYSLSPRRFLRLTPARCPHLHPRNTFPSGTTAAPKWHLVGHPG